MDHRNCDKDICQLARCPIGWSLSGNGWLRLLWGTLLGIALAQPVSADTLLGVSYGKDGFDIDQLRALETWQARKNAVVNLFTSWEANSKIMKNLFSLQLPAIWNNGNVPMVTWQPFTGKNTPNDIEARIADGGMDSYIHAWADKMKGFLAGPDNVYDTADDRRVYLRLGHEMNGDWYPWGAALGNDSPEDYKRMWQRVWLIFRDKGIDQNHLQWIWSVNNADFGGFNAESYYPGDEYVDWVAVDGYNWGGSYWNEPNSVYDEMLGRLRLLASKPLAITETASTSLTAHGDDVAAKSQWITRIFEYAWTQDVRMMIWFNKDKEMDWAVFGGATGDETYAYGRTNYRAYQAYREATGNDNLVSSDVFHPRLLTDTQFQGQ